MNTSIPSSPKKLSGRLRVWSVLIAYAIIAMGFYLYIYSQTKVWQAFIPVTFVAFSVLLSIPAFWLSKQEKSLGAGALTALAFGVAYAGQELVWGGLTPIHLIGGSLLMILAGSLTLSRRYKLWAAFLAGYLAYTIWVNRVEPLPRIDPSFIPALLPYAVLSTLSLAFILAMQVFFSYPARSIQTRLMGTWMVLLFVSLSVILLIAVSGAVENAKSQALRQLEAVADLREQSIHAWLDRLTEELRAFSPSEGDIQLWAVVRHGSESSLSSGAVQAIQDRFIRLVHDTKLFHEIFLVDSDGVVVLSSDAAHIGLLVADQPYYQQGRLAEYMMPPSVSRDGLLQMTVAVPLQTTAGLDLEAGNPVLIAGHVNLQKLDELLSPRAGLGDSGETYLVARSHRLLTPSLYPDYEAGKSFLFSYGIDQALEKQSSGSEVYPGYRGNTVLGVYRWLPRLQSALVVEQSQAEIHGKLVRSMFFDVSLMILAALSAALMGWMLTSRITAPLKSLARTSERIASGELHLAAEVEDIAEIGSLAKAMNTLSGQLRSVLSGLEQRVQERTAALEKRAAQIQIAAEVAREAASLQNMQELLCRAVDLIHDRLEYYFAGIYLVDEVRNHAVLAAATGEAGQVLMERNHSVPIGEASLVGEAALTGRIRIIEDVERYPFYEHNPLFPETRSEIAIPLKAGSDVIGVLEVHSDQPRAFSEETIFVLQIVTDQLTIAMQNARLIQEMRQTVQELESVYGSFTQKAWLSIERRSLAEKGYQYRNLIVQTADEEHPAVEQAIRSGKTTVLRDLEGSAASESGSVLAVPVKVRGQTIGAFALRFRSSTVPRTAIAMYEDLADRLALILENARLLQEAQSLAMREQQINLISTRVRSSIHFETVLQNAVQELGKAFGTARTFIQVALDDSPVLQSAQELQDED